MACKYRVMAVLPNISCPLLNAVEQIAKMSIELVLPLTHPSPQPKRKIDWFSRFCTDHGRVSLYFTTGRPPPLKLTLPMGDLDPYLTRDSLDPSEPKPKRHLDRLSRFCTDDRRVSLYFTMGLPFPSKLPLPMGDLDPHPMRGSLGPPESST